MVWPAVLCETPQVQERLIQLDNNGPLPLKVRWQLYDMSLVEVDRSVNVSFEFSSASSSSASLSTVITPYIPPKAASDFPFSVSPSELCVPPSGSAWLTVRFDPRSLAYEQDYHGCLSAEILVPSARHPHYHTSSQPQQQPYGRPIPNRLSESMMRRSPRARRPASPPSSSLRLNAVISELDDFDEYVSRQRWKKNASVRDENENGDGDVDSSEGRHEDAKTAADHDEHVQEDEDTWWAPAPAALSRHALRLFMAIRVMNPSLTLNQAHSRLSRSMALSMPVASASMFAVDQLSTTLPMVEMSSVGEFEVCPATLPAPAIAVLGRDASVPSFSEAKLAQQLSSTHTGLVQRSAHSERTGRLVKLEPEVSDAIALASSLPAVVSKQALTMYNRSAMPLQFSMTTEPPELFRVAIASKRVKADAETDSYTLAANQNLSMTVQCTPPPMRHPDLPLRMQNRVQGQVLFHFSNGTEQSLPLSAVFYRPVLQVSPSQHHFGLAYALGDTRAAASVPIPGDRSRITVNLSLHNPSMVDAYWKLVHVASNRASSHTKTQALGSSMSPHTLNSLSNPEFDEDREALDDPSVFQFATTGGVVPGRAHSRSGANVLSLSVEFHPNRVAAYASRFRFVVANAALDEGLCSLDVVLRGQGSHDERYAL